MRALLSLLIAAPSLAQCPYELLLNPGAGGNDLFGWDVGVADPYLAVGARWENEVGFGSGVVHTWVHDDLAEAWVYEGSLVGSTTEGSDNFGYAVDMTDTWLAVASVGDDVGGFSAVGSVTLFRRVAGAWSEHSVLLPPGGLVSYTSFGRQLDLDGERLIVASSKRNANAYHYDAGLDQWVHVQQLIPSHGDGGAEVSLGGDVALINDASVKLPPFNHQGSVFVFEWDAGAGQYVETQALTTPDAPFNDYFAVDAATDGETIVAGVWASNLPDGHPVYVYEREAPGGAWKLSQRLFSGESTFGQNGIDVRGDEIVVGAYGNSRSHQYLRDPFTGRFEAHRVWQGLGAGPEFGRFADIGPRFTVLGAPQGSGGGRAVVLDTSRCGVIGDGYCPAIPNSTGEQGRTLTLGVTLAGGEPFEAAGLYLPDGQPALLLASEHENQVIPPGSDGLLCLGSPIARFPDVQVVANGQVWYEVDTTDIPLAPPVAIQPGETWHFQIWHRDVSGAGSNLAAPSKVQFQ